MCGALRGNPTPCHRNACLILTPRGRRNLIFPIRTPSMTATPLKHLLFICVDLEMIGSTQRPIDRCVAESRDMKGCRPMHQVSTRQRPSLAALERRRHEPVLGPAVLQPLDAALHEGKPEHAEDTACPQLHRIPIHHNLTRPTHGPT